MTRYALTTEAYTEDELVKLLTDLGFVDVEAKVSLDGAPEAGSVGLFALVART